MVSNDLSAFIFKDLGRRMAMLECKERVRSGFTRALLTLEDRPAIEWWGGASA